ncbi:MAG: (Fe-S)-binding protein [Methanimicrococcus sp.]|nr:(Fe-S)-binding protein [Methanimicrococcus sp.]
MSFEKVDIRDLYRCVSCGNCRSVCPVFEQTGRESKNTRGRILIIRGVYEGVLDDDSVFDSINTCTTCGYCTEACPAGVDPPKLVETAREGLAKLGKMTPTQAKIRDTVARYSNTLGDDGDRLGWLKEAENGAGETKEAGNSGLKLELPEKPKAVYFVGCLDSYRYPKTALKTYRILKNLGVGLLEDEKCCGSPLLRLGLSDEAAGLVKHNTEQIKKSGADTVIASCAGCFNTLKNDYDLTGITVMTVSEYLMSHIKEFKEWVAAENSGIQKLDIPVTYHDSCHSGRHNHIFEEPRALIREIVGADNFKEMEACREKSRCCGGGGGVRSGYNELSMAMAKRRLEDVPAGVEYIITACPLCLRNLSDAGGDIPVIDIVELLSMAIKK